jgi:hypothetical protein
MIATPGAGNNSAVVITADGGDAYTFLNAGPVASTGYVLHATNVAAGNTLQIGGQVAANPMVELNAPLHVLTLGDGNAASVVDVPAASILLDASLASTVATGGVVNVDVSGVSIATSTNAGITVSNTQTTVRGNYHFIADLPGTITAATVYTLTSPTKTGLYAITITGNLDPVGILCGVTTLAHFLVGSGYVSGGNNSAILAGGGNSYARLFLTEGVEGKVMNFQYVSVDAASLTGMSCRIVQLTGDLGF